MVIKKDGQEELLAAFCERIERGEGVECQFFHQKRRYLFLDDYKYWIMVECSDVDLDAEDHVLNRARFYRDRRDFVIQGGDTGMRGDYPASPGVLAGQRGLGTGVSMTEAGRPSEHPVPPETTPVDRISSWEAHIRAMKGEWRDISERQTRALLADWQRAMSEMRHQHDRLVSDGLWVSGPSDILDIIGLARHENTHSRMLEWLLKPTSRHGLGCGLVRCLVEHCTGEPVATPVAVRRVVFSYWRNNREADLVVWGQDFTLIIENKVDAAEQPDQCDDLYENFKNEIEPLFLFLTPNGSQPHTATTDGAQRAFKALSWPQVRAMLEAALNESQPATAVADAVEVVGNYLRTLKEQFG